jgi:hypothetical protein
MIENPKQATRPRLIHRFFHPALFFENFCGARTKQANKQASKQTKRADSREFLLLDHATKIKQKAEG